MLTCFFAFYSWITMYFILCPPPNPLFPFNCNPMLQIWVHLSTHRLKWSGWCLKFLCRHTLLIFFFFCQGTSFLCATFTIIMIMMDRVLTCMMFSTTLVNSELYKNSINVYVVLVLKLNLISLSIWILVSSPTRYNIMKLFIDHQKFMKKLFVLIYIVTCLVP